MGALGSGLIIEICDFRVAFEIWVSGLSGLFSFFGLSGLSGLFSFFGAQERYKTK